MITSTDNSKVKKAFRLKERRDRDRESLFLIEGYREVLRAVAGGVTVHTLFICSDHFLGVNEPALIDEAKSLGAEIIECSEKVFSKLSYRDRPDGLLAVAVQMKSTFADLLTHKKSMPFLLIAEGIEKPGNLGTMLRSADAVGANGVIVCDRCTDIYNPNVVRASVGTLFTQPVVEAESGETLLWLRQKKIRVVAATPQAKTTFTDADLNGPIAVVVGTEQLGLSEVWLHASDMQVSIPMLGAADSLNVASAATLLLYEIVRQRRSPFGGSHFLR